MQVFLQCLSYLGIASLVSVNLVYPKIKRAWNGEKVVVGNLLRAYGNEEQNIGSTDGIIAGIQVILKKNDALPPSLEAEIHRLHALVGIIREKW